MVRPERFELPAFWFVARRSIQLSYGRTVLQLPQCTTLPTLSQPATAELHFAYAQFCPHPNLDIALSTALSDG